MSKTPIWNEQEFFVFYNRIFVVCMYRLRIFQFQLDNQSISHQLASSETKPQKERARLSLCCFVMFLKNLWFMDFTLMFAVLFMQSVSSTEDSNVTASSKLRLLNLRDSMQCNAESLIPSPPSQPRNHSLRPEMHSEVSGSSMRRQDAVKNGPRPGPARQATARLMDALMASLQKTRRMEHEIDGLLDLNGRYTINRSLWNETMDELHERIISIFTLNRFLIVNITETLVTEMNKLLRNLRKSKQKPTSSMHLYYDGDRA